MECFPLFTSPFPGDGYDASILYARRVCSLNNEEKSYFCRDSDLPSYRFKCLRAACVSLLMLMSKTCGETCANEPSRYFIGLRVFCREYAKYGELTYRRCKILLCTRCDYFV